MPQEKRPGKHVFWWTCRRTLSHCGFLLAYLFNGLLLIAAGSLLFLLFSAEVPVPRFVTRAIEANLAAEGLGQRIESIQIDSGGRILLNGIRLYSRTYDEPLAFVDHALIRIDLPALLFGRVQASDIRISNGRLVSPSAVSPSGLPAEVIGNISGSARLAAGRLQIEHLHFNSGRVRAIATGSLQIPEKGTPAGSRPGLSAAIAQLIARIPDMMRIQDIMSPLEAATVRIRFSPNREDGYDAAVDLMADGYRSADGINLRGLDASILVETRRGELRSIRAGGGVSRAEKPGLARIGSALFRAEWTALPTRANPYPESLDIRIRDLTARQATLRNTLLSVRRTTDRPVRFFGSTVLGGETVEIAGAVDPGQGGGTVAVAGRAGADWLHLASEIIGSDITYYADLSGRPVYRAGADFAPDWSWTRARFEVTASDLMARGVLLDSAYARGEITPFGVTVDPIEIRQGQTRASMSYSDTFATRDYRFLIRGSMRPVSIAGWFGPWWENFWKDFELPPDGGTCDLSIHGNWFGPRKTLVTGEVAAGNLGLKGLRFDRLRTRLLIRPHYFDLFDATASRPEGRIEGEFQLLYKTGERLPIEQHFKARSTIDLKKAAVIFGPGGVEMLAPYDYQVPPSVDFRGSVLRTDAVWDTDITLGIDTDHAFQYEEFPLDSLQARDVRILNRRVELPSIRAGYAGGILAGNALVDQGRLSFGATLDQARFEEAITRFGDYLDRNAPPSEDSADKRFEDRNPGGLLSLSLQAEGDLGNFNSYLGEGRLDVTEAELGRVHLFGVLSAALQSTMFRFSTIRFTEAHSDLQIDRNELFFPNLEISGPLAAIKSVGSYDIPTGAVDFQARFFPFAGGGLPVFSVLDTVLNPFSYVFEINMTGTLSAPRMGVSIGGTEKTRPFATDEEPPTADPD